MPPFSDRLSRPLKLCQFYLANNYAHFGVPDLPARVTTMLSTMLRQEGVRLPGAKRLEARQKAEVEGVEVEESLCQTLEHYAKKAARD